MNLFFAFLAGLLTTLSPCVLPVLPFVTASSLNKNRFGPLYLASGLLVSFVSVSLLVSTTGLLFGLDPAITRKAAGLLMVLSGVVFLSPRIAEWLSLKLSFLANRANAAAPSRHGVALSEFMNGVLLGVVWTPCSGPSLGAALGLAAQEGEVARAGLVLLAFGLGAVIPLMVFAYGARKVIGSIRNHLAAIHTTKIIFGILIIAFGMMTVFGMDRSVEAALTQMLPDSWLEFLTKF